MHYYLRSAAARTGYSFPPARRFIPFIVQSIIYDLLKTKHILNAHKRALQSREF